MGLMNSLMLSCRKATELMERASLQPLPMGERLRLWMHVKVCHSCHTFQKQGHLIDALLKDRSAPPSDASGTEERIMAAIAPKEGRP